ncbi:hypothetical protein HP439_06770 [Sphingobacterium shayense]|uniref:COG1470 family protein n=1 Tax=Sphingobacterium shayense TaxID=626343 RepID=UPI001554B931|nr:NEW3 domain-containing protein [Sphingobacterium shayense]NQD70418.1 hypothetical protein [Sphingobacterium shayense]
MLTELRTIKLYQLSIFVLFIAVSCSITTVLKAQSTLIAKQSSFEAKLLNIEASSKDPFRYNATLVNGSAEPEIFELTAQLPAGWQATYRIDGSQVTSIRMDAGQSRDINIEVNAPLTAKPAKYNLNFKAISKTDTLSLALEAALRGSYAVELTTPSGRLSDEVTVGAVKELKLIVKNSGTLPLNKLELKSQLPNKWEATFEPATIEQIEVGKSAEVQVSIKVPEKTIAGDYAAKLSVKNSDAQAETSFRFMVTTSLLSGWIGIVIILIAIGLVFVLIRKYGRR